MKLNYKGKSKVLLRLCESVNELIDKTTALTESIGKKQDGLTFDKTPTKDSSNPVTSGGVFSEFERVEAAQVKLADGKLQVTIEGKTYKIAQETEESGGGDSNG